MSRDEEMVRDLEHAEDLLCEAHKVLVKWGLHTRIDPSLADVRKEQDEVYGRIARNARWARKGTQNVT